LTKVVACTPAVMLLLERGKIALEDKVAKYIPEFAAEEAKSRSRHLSPTPPGCGRHQSQAGLERL
jgi:CubicO group peptidase (beta-lactamase class C family)